MFLVSVFGGVLLAALVVSVILRHKGGQPVATPPPVMSEPPVQLEETPSGDAWAASAPPETTDIPPQKRAVPANDSTIVSSEITSPLDGESVPRVFQMSGTCGAMPAGQQLWLVVQTGRVFSPKGAAKVDGQNWEGTVKEYGVGRGGSFEVCLYQVNEEGVALIAEWNARGRATGSWPPFREVPGGIFLAKIKLRLAP